MGVRAWKNGSGDCSSRIMTYRSDDTGKTLVILPFGIIDLRIMPLLQIIMILAIGRDIVLSVLARSYISISKA